MATYFPSFPIYTQFQFKLFFLYRGQRFDEILSIIILHNYNSYSYSHFACVDRFLLSRPNSGCTALRLPFPPPLFRKNNSFTKREFYKSFPLLLGSY